MEHERWCIILAAGDGTRLHPVTTALYGHPLPKQFARLVEDESLLQSTVRRFAAIAPPSRTIVVVAEEWQAIARRQLADTPEIEIVVQPANLGTGPGILLPLAHVLRRASPGATVVVTPSDHHFARSCALHEAIEHADLMVRDDPRHVVLLGAVPDRACSDLGWIVADDGAEGRGELRRVRRFVEKPSDAVSEHLRQHGAFWNTFVMVGTVEAFWAHARAHLPAQASLLERHVAHAPESRMRPQALRAAYEEIESANFSKDVLERSPDLYVMPLSDSGWCDWGTPESLFETLRGTPAFDALVDRMSVEASVAAE